MHKIKKLQKEKKHLPHLNGKLHQVQQELLMEKLLIETIQMNSTSEVINVEIKMHGGKSI